MWVVLGQRVRTEPFEGARRKTLTCSKCERARLHVEQRVVHTATAFFTPLVNVRQHTVLECSACGTQLRDGSTSARWFASQDGTALGKVGDTLQAAVASVARPEVVEGARATVGQALDKLQELGATVFDELAPQQAAPPDAEEVAEPEPEREPEPAGDEGGATPTGAFRRRTL